VSGIRKNKLAALKFASGRLNPPGTPEGGGYGRPLFRRRSGTLLAAGVLLAGFGLLVFLYWPVLLTGTAGFLVVSRALRRRRGFRVSRLPEWMTALAAWRAAGRIGR
jgi:hypothetical protein